MLNRYIDAPRALDIAWVVGACEDIAKQAKGIRESGARTLPTPILSSVRFNPRGLHYDGMHNARWVRRRAVCASYIAMADGRDSEKDFPNGISSPRTAYIFHGRGRANRLPFLSSIFCAPRDMSRLLPIDVDEWNISRSLSRGSWKLAGKSERKMYILERKIYKKRHGIARERRRYYLEKNYFDYKNFKTFR